MTRILGQIIGEDVFFKSAVWWVFLNIVGIEGATRWLAVKVYVLPALASSTLWFIVAWRDLRPIDRWHRGASDEASLRAAGIAASRAPGRFALVSSLGWGLALGSSCLVLHALAGPNLPPGAGLGMLLLVVAMMIGAPTLSAMHMTHGLTEVTGRISLAARRRGLDVATASSSMRRRNALNALGLALSPTLFLTGMSYLDGTRAAREATSRNATLRATELALRVAGGGPSELPPDGLLLDARGAVLGGGGAVAPALLSRGVGALADGRPRAVVSAGGEVLALVRAGDRIVAVGAREAAGMATALFGRLWLFFLGVVVFVLLTAWYSSTNMVTVVERVAAALREIAQAGGVSGTGRIPILQRDELAVLVESANGMIDRLEEAQAASLRAAESLRQSNLLLEQRVEERTAALRVANHDLEENLERLMQARSQLAEAARKAGMAEVASSVLHNVGNVLNSVNVSTAMLGEKLRGSSLAAVRKTLDLIPTDEDAAAAFLAGDPRGRRVPVYLRRVAEVLAGENAALLGELAFLEKHIEHIKVIISLQQAHAKQGGLVEPLRVGELIDDALRFTLESGVAAGPRVARELDAAIEVVSDRHRLFQILVNLLRNARDAVSGGDVAAPCVTVRSRATDDAVLVEVADNGCGVAPENLDRIFNLGFTTKPNGHGYGLHSSALAARELGGELAVHSDGPGRGARFTLHIPRRPRAGKLDGATRPLRALA